MEFADIEGRSYSPPPEGDAEEEALDESEGLPTAKRSRLNSDDASQEVLNGLLEWEQTFFERISAAYPGSASTFAASARRPMVLTESYAGVQTGSYAFKRQYTHLQKVHNAHESDVVLYSTWEIDKNARTTQNSFPVGHRPIHSFGDIMGMLSVADQEEINKLWRHASRAFAELGQSASSEASQLQAQEIALNFQNEMHMFFENVQYNEFAYCRYHDRYCAISPRHPDPSVGWLGIPESGLWLELAGNTCCPWSGMNQVHSGGTAYLDYSSVIMYTWLYGVRFFQPDAVLQENVTRFDNTILRVVLCNPEDEAVHAKDSCVPMPMSVREIQPTYSMVSVPVCPTVLRIPSRRPRGYNLLLLVGPHRWLLAAEGEDRIVLPGKLFPEDLSCTCDVYLRASPEMIDAAFVELLEKTGVDASAPGGHDTTWEDVLQPGFRSRLIAWRRWARNSGIVTDDLPCALVSLQWNAEWSKQIDSTTMPTFLKESHLWDLKRGRLLTLEECWVSMGWPLRGFSSNKELVDAMPLPIETMTSAMARPLVGNSMHVAAVGFVSALFLGLAETFVDGSANAAES